MVYDLFCINDELELLELRLNVLNEYVDKFVISESIETFSGLPKKLSYDPERFKKWSDKIIYLNPPPIQTDDPFQRAGYQKDFLRQSLFDIAKDDDIVYFGDIDELYKPQDIKDNKIYSLEQFNYSYYLNNRSSERWVGTVVGKWVTFKTNTVNYWRANHTNEIKNAGWHFTNLLTNGIETLYKKLECYDHAHEVNTPWVRDGLQARINANTDFLGRQIDWEGRPFKMWVEEENLPTYLLENKDKYKHLWK